jgi:antitoxin Phd
MNHHPRVWQLQEAKARFSELVRLAQTEGPQTVTVHGKAAVTITRATSASRAGTGTGADLVAALREGALGLPDIDLPEWDTPGEFRDVGL